MPRTKKTEPNHHGVLLVDKPQGWTSHDIVAKVRGFAKQRQVGHTGTLDPMATGLLVVCLGNGTRLAEYMAGHDKRYEGEVTLGSSTTTDDTEGEILHARPVPELTRELLNELQTRFTGTISQRPPAFSAVKVAGQRAYAVARSGGDPRLEPRVVHLHSIAIRPTGSATLAITVHCGPGTYVRSLARDIGEAMGSAGHLSALRRVASGPFTVADAWTLEALQRLVTAGRFGMAIAPPDDGITDLEAAIIGPESAAAFTHGARVATEAVRESETVRIYASGGNFIGIGRISGDRLLHPVKVLTV